MAATDTPPVQTSFSLVRENGKPTDYFKRFLDVLWTRTGGLHDISDVVNNLSALTYIVQTASTYLSGERVATDTGRIAWDFSTVDQAKLDLVAASVAYSYIQNVSASDRLLGRQTAGAGTIEEIVCTAAGRALLDDANAAAQLTTLGVSAFIQTLLDDTDAATARATLGISAGSWTEYEVDFGSTPVYDATFTIVDGAVTATTEVAVMQSGSTATGRAAGDALFDSISYAASPGSGSFTLYALASPGPIVGKRKILYQVGT